VLQLKEKVCSKKTMQLEEYFEVFAPDDIRIKGHRIGIEDVINYHLKGYTSQQILQELPSLNLSMPGHLKNHWDKVGQNIYN